MKIVYKKGCDLETVLHFMNGFIRGQAEEYPILKEDMVIEIVLKNSIGQINPDNEREFSFDEKKISDLIESEGLWYGDEIFKQHWDSFICDYTEEIRQHLEKEKSRLVEAKEKRRTPQTIKKREERIKEAEEMLRREQERIIKLQPFVELFEKGQVQFKYVYEPYNDRIDKRAFFEIDGKVYYFAYYYGVYATPDSVSEQGIFEQSGEIVLYRSDR